MNDDELLDLIRLFLAACALILDGKPLPLRVYTVLEDVLNDKRASYNLFAERMYSRNQHNFLRGLAEAHKIGYLSVDRPGFVRINLPTATRIRYEPGFRDAEEVARAYLLRVGA